VLVVGEPRLETAPASAVHVESPTSVSELRTLLRSPLHETYDAALINAWGREVDLTDLAVVVRRAVQPGGTVAFVAPVAQVGWRGARGAVLGLLRRQRPVPLEALCGALLHARFLDIRARPLEGASGYSVVWGTVPPIWREDIESSAVLPSLER